MRCEEMMRRLDDLVDGESVFETINQDSQLCEHIEGCDDCRRQAEETARLMAQVARLPRSVEPDRDLWPQIRERIETHRVVSFSRRERRAGHWSWHQVLGVAAVLVIAVTVTLTYSRYLQTSGQPGERVAEAPTPSLSDAAYTVLGAFSNGDGGLQAARQELLAAVEARSDSLSPQTLATVMDSLQVIQGSIDSITAAVKENPDDTRLTHLLASAHRQEIDLLQRAVGLPNEI